MALLLAGVALGQVIDASALGAPVRLKGEWRFQAGDDPAWASPSFDDSGWRTVSTEKDWDAQGLQKVRGFMWFRLRLKMPPGSSPLRLFAYEPGPYQVFIDGQHMGQLGDLTRKPVPYADFPRSYSFPVRHGAVCTVAIRYYVSPLFFHVNKISTTLLVGSAEEVRRREESLINKHLADGIPRFVFVSTSVVLSMGLVVLFLLQRDHTEYIFLSVTLIAMAFNVLLDDIMYLRPVALDLKDYASGTSSIVASMSMIEFAFRFLRQPVPRWFRTYQLSMPLVLVLIIAIWSGLVPMNSGNTAGFLFLVPYWFITPGLVVWRFIRGNKEAGLLAVPLLLVMLNDMIGMLSWVLYLSKLTSKMMQTSPDFHFGLITIDLGTIFAFAFLLSVGALILYRFQTTRVEQVRASAELEAARSMQEVMVPTQVAAAAFRIETVYLPAQEVGGDFFQLYPRADGSLMVVIGDVSGKGVKAAMLVSLIVGLLRSLVQRTTSPARLLNELNGLLIGQTGGKFATCCCALLYPDGRAVIANAGHLSPYCDGEELDGPGGLPLGISDEAAYEQQEIDARPRRRWIFLSDGVVEARNKAGELYGFERARSISVQTVDEIAHTAQKFGQEDDITVVGIEPLPVPVG